MTVAGDPRMGPLVPLPGYSGDGGPATSAELNTPTDVARDSSGNLFIADNGNHVIRRVDVFGTITTFSTTAAFGLAVGPGTPLYASDPDAGRVYSFSNTGTALPLMTGVVASGLAVDAAGNLFVPDAGNDVVLKRTPAGVVSVVAGTSGSGCGLVAENVIAIGTTLCDPLDVAVAPNGDVFVTDLGNNRVRKIEASTGRIRTYAGGGPLVSIFPNGLGGPATQAWFFFPRSIALDPQGDLFIAHHQDQHVPIHSYMRVDAHTGLIDYAFGNQCSTPIGGGSYVGCFDGDCDTADDSSFSFPEGIIFEGSGRAFVADSRNHRVRQIEAYAWAAPSTSLLSFGQTEVGQTTTRVLTIRNTGTAPMRIEEIPITGINAGDFSIVSTSCTGGAIPAGGTCSVTIAFHPLVIGVRTATLRLTGNSLRLDRIAVTLEGEGVSRPRIVVTPGSIGFPNRGVGTISPPETITVSSVGTMPATITGVVLDGSHPGHFLIVDSCSSLVLPAGSSCTINVRYAPLTNGFHRARVTVSSDGGSGVVNLVGSAGPFIGVYPASLVFEPRAPGTTSPPKTLTITNTGSGLLDIGAITVEGDHTADFGVLNPCTGTSLGAGATCVLQVRFTPAVAGLRTAAVRINSNAPTGPAMVPMSGTGLDVIPPVSDVETPAHSILVSILNRVTGRTTDDFSGVDRVKVKFTPLLLGVESTVTASLDCTTSRLDCGWSATIPLIPGIYEVTAAAQDRAGNVEVAGPGVVVLIL